MSRTDDRDSDAEIQRILRRALSRRQFLGRTAAAAGGLAFGSSFLAACKGKEQAGGESATKVVRVSNWPLYIDAKTVPDFEAATGIKVEYTEDINDNNE
ncbi:MAG TPA: twin-arginine translocation signal domain-containing protein, partial [Gemmatimonadales bacterium]|nr:twin-arginine translocation signal domain-containing protein [Gemmatimonadales bacterium]